MGVISRASFSTGDVPTAAEWNTQFDTAYNCINGNIDSNNLAANAVIEAKITNGAVTKNKLGTMEYVVAFAYNPTFAASGENLRQIMFPYAGTITKVELRTGHECTAFAIDVGKADINSSSIGSSFFVAGSASVTASGSTVSVTGASLTNTSITANTKMIITAKTWSTGCGVPLLVNVFVDV